MKLLFISNFLNHHQLPICNEFYKLLGNSFKFVACEKVPKNKVSLGYNKDFNVPYLIDGTDENNVWKYLKEFDILIAGSCPIDYVEYFITTKKLLFVYSERLFKDGTWHKYSPLARFNIHSIYNKNFNDKMYLLCSSAYTASDFNDFNSFKNHYLKWGYFPKLSRYTYNELIENKVKNSIIWVGRLIGWKHPEQAVYLGKFLKENNIDFNMEIIGDGPLKDKLIKLINKHNLNDQIKITGPMHFEKVRSKMENSELFIFTSDFNEGWGAVLNEAMSSGCTCIASYKAGSTLFLLNNNNGTIYDNTQKDLNYKAFEYLKNNKLKLIHSENAFNTIKNLWNYKVAAINFVDFATKILKRDDIILPHEGPMSKAEIISNKNAKNMIFKTK